MATTPGLSPAPAPAAAPLAPWAPPTTLTGVRLAKFLWNARHDPIEPLCLLPGAPGVVRITNPFGDVFLIRSPADVRQTLITNQDNYLKGDDYKVLGVMLGQGLLTNRDMPSWQRQRKLVQPMFAKRHLAPMGDHMIAAASDWLERWDRETAAGPVELDAHRAMNALTLDVVGRALFGATVDDATTKTVGQAMTQVLHAGSFYLRQGFVTRIIETVTGLSFEGALKTRPLPWRRAQKAIRTMDGIVEQVIAAHRSASAPDEGNLLGLLLAARDEETGEAMSLEQVRDEVMTFLGAGHETTANALSWMWLLLSQHPEARERVHEEVDRVLGGRTPTVDDVERLPYTTAVLHEALRLYPPAPVITRVAQQADEVGGQRIPKGALVFVLTYAIHRDPTLWPNPEGFDPRRFLTPEQGGTMSPDRPRQAFMPFGAGRRICVGSSFALMEGVLLGAMIAQRFTLDLKPGKRITPEIAITLRPQGELPMTLRRRAA